MLAAAKFSVQVGLRSFRWAPPLVTYLVILVLLNAFQARFDDTIVPMAATLFFVAIWLGVQTIGGDDVGHQSVVAVLSGGRTGARMGRALAAFGVVAVLAVLTVAVVGWNARNLGFPERSAVRAPIQCVISVPALIVIGLVGVCSALIVGWPVLQRQSVAACSGFVIGLVLLIVPGSPVRGLLRVLARINLEVRAAEFLLAFGGSLVLATALVAAATFAARRRWRLARE